MDPTARKVWDAAIRSHLSVRNYGFFLDLGRGFQIDVNITDPCGANPPVQVAFHPVEDFGVHAIFFAEIKVLGSLFHPGAGSRETNLIRQVARGWICARIASNC